MLINVTSRYKYGVHVNIFFILVFFNFSFINSDLFRLTNLINVFFFWKNGNIRTDRFFSRFGFGKFYFLLIAIVKIANSENFYWNANFLPNNFDFFTKVRLFTKRCWPKFQFLPKISIFTQNFDFYPKFRFLPKISIFAQNFDFYPKFWILVDFFIKFDQYFLSKSKTVLFPFTKQIGLLSCLGYCVGGLWELSFLFMLCIFQCFRRPIYAWNKRLSIKDAYRQEVRELTK